VLKGESSNDNYHVIEKVFEVREGAKISDVKYCYAEETHVDPDIWKGRPADIIKRCAYDNPYVPRRLHLYCIGEENGETTYTRTNRPESCVFAAPTYR
jgi:hypothetical protein